MNIGLLETKYLNFLSYFMILQLHCLVFIILHLHLCFIFLLRLLFECCFNLLLTMKSVINYEICYSLMLFECCCVYFYT
jgi:hypothetical protein